MKKMNFSIGAIVLTILLIMQTNCYGQHSKTTIDNYFEKLPRNLKVTYHNAPQKYVMTATYNNKDLYGNFMNKTRVTGEYTCGLDTGLVRWNNVYLANSNSLKDAFPQGALQNPIF